MIKTIKKIKKYGFKGLSSYIAIRIITMAKVFFYRWFISSNHAKLSGTRLFAPTQFMGQGDIVVEKAQLGVLSSPYLFSGSGYLESRSHSAKIMIGPSTVINNNFSLIADKTSIFIGERCLIGPNFFATDSDFHGIKVIDRNSVNYACLPVKICDDVFVGDGVRILKGVTIGAGAVIGSGSVVVSDVMPNSVYAGVPAKFIKKC